MEVEVEMEVEVIDGTNNNTPRGDIQGRRELATAAQTSLGGHGKPAHREEAQEVEVTFSCKRHDDRYNQWRAGTQEALSSETNMMTNTTNGALARRSDDSSRDFFFEPIHT